MIDSLTTFIDGAGWLAPLYYIGSFVLTALLPFIPTPLVAALGGTAFGFLPAVAYGMLGMGIGAVVSLSLARAVGRPLLRRLVRPEVWAQWEEFLGIRSPVVWGVVFFVLNLDFAVAAAGLTTLSIRSLWVAAVVARAPWLMASAWFGDVVLVNDGIVLLMTLLLLPGVYLLGKLRPLFQRWLLLLSRGLAPVPAAMEASKVAEPRVEDVANGVSQKVEAHD
jgi:uncharacterized membrane protein YdjX (TVP38/TMEM64 family)